MRHEVEDAPTSRYALQRALEAADELTRMRNVLAPHADEPLGASLIAQLMSVGKRFNAVIALLEAMEPRS